MTSHDTPQLSRRSFLRGGAAAFGAALLAACGAAPTTPAGAPAEAPTTAAPAQPGGLTGTLTWYMNIDPDRNKWAEEAVIPAFTKANPGVTINLMTVPWDEYDSKLLALAAAGTPPDVFSQWGQSGGGTYFHKNLLHPIEDLIQSRGWDLSGVPENLRRAYAFEGQTYGVPMYSLGSFFFYNRKLFTEAGVEPPPIDWNDESWTWSEMVSRAKALTKDYGNMETGQYGLVIAMNDLYGGVPWQFGADIFSADSYEKGRVTEVNFTDPKFVAAVQARADLITKDQVSPTAATTDTISGGGNLLGSGRVAMLYGGGWEMWSFKSLNDLDWGLGAVPRQERNLIPTFSDPWYIGKGSKNIDASFALIQFLTTGDGQRSMALGLAAPPALQSLLPEWYANFPTVPTGAMETVYKGAIAVARETPASLLFGYGAVEDAYNQAMTAVWNGEKSAEEVIPELQDRATEAIRNL